MSSTTLMILVGLPLGAMMLGFIAMTFAAGYAARSSGAARTARAVPHGQVSPKAFAEARELIDRGLLIQAIKLIRKDSGMGLKEAKDYAEAMKAGRIQPPVTASAGPLSARVRAFLDAGDRDSAVALVQAETGMSRQEAARFVDALD